MIKIPLAALRRKVSSRPEGYYEEVILSGRVVNDEVLEVDEEAHRKLCEKYRGPNPLPAKQNCC